MKVFFAYSILLINLLIIHQWFSEIKEFLIPLLLIVLTLLFSEKIHFYLKKSDLFFGLKFSLFILLPPFILALFYLGRVSTISINLLLYQIFAVAIPEELFFRGFIQHSLGNNVKAVLISSLLFSFAHLPNVLFDKNLIALLVFFPSLMMGWLYMKRLNILPSIIFHFLSNVCYSLVFVQIMVK